MSGDDQSGIPQASVRSGSVEIGAPTGPPPDGYRPLFDLVAPSTVTWAAFLAGPAAAIWLIARNFRRLGRTAAMWWTIAAGLAVTAAMLALALRLPDGPAFLISLPLIWVAWLVATRTQGRAFDDHERRLGPRTSGGKVVLISIAALVVQVGLLVGGAIGYEIIRRGPKVDLGHGHEVYYRNGATEVDAWHVGEVLERTGFFPPEREASATLQRAGDGFALGLVVNDQARTGAYDDDYRELARGLSDEVFDGRPVDVWLLDSELEVRRRLPWDPAP